MDGFIGVLVWGQQEPHGAASGRAAREGGASKQVER
jgi:hypothetical protein